MQAHFEKVIKAMDDTSWRFCKAESGSYKSSTNPTLSQAKKFNRPEVLERNIKMIYTTLCKLFNDEATGKEAAEILEADSVPVEQARRKRARTSVAEAQGIEESKSESKQGDEEMSSDDSEDWSDFEEKDSVLESQEELESPFLPPEDESDEELFPEL